MISINQQNQTRKFTEHNKMEIEKWKNTKKRKTVENVEDH